MNDGSTCVIIIQFWIDEIIIIIILSFMNDGWTCVIIIQFWIDEIIIIIILSFMNDGWTCVIIIQFWIDEIKKTRPTFLSGQSFHENILLTKEPMHLHRVNFWTRTERINKRLKQNTKIISAINISSKIKK